METGKLTWRKLRNGDWGVFADFPLYPGDCFAVESKAGKVSWVVINNLVWTNKDDAWIAAVKKVKRWEAERMMCGAGGGEADYLVPECRHCNGSGREPGGEGDECRHCG